MIIVDTAFFWFNYMMVLPFLLVVWLVPIGLALLFCLLVPRTKGQWIAILLGTAALSAVATASGYLAGVSRESVMGDILPVILTGTGATAGLAVVQGKLRVELASAAVLGFTLCLFFSALWGSYIRGIAGEGFQAITIPGDLDPDIEGGA